MTLPFSFYHPQLDLIACVTFKKYFLMKDGTKPVIHEAIIASKIIVIRDEKVILDVHLAELYEVETRALKQAVKRN